MSRPQPWRARRLAAEPPPAVAQFAATGTGPTVSRGELEPILVTLVEAWRPPSQPRQTPSAAAERTVGRVLDWLSAQPGADWAARWTASGADDQPRHWPALALMGQPAELRTAELTGNALIVVRAVRPTLAWLLGATRMRLQDDWTLLHDRALFDRARADLSAASMLDRVAADTIGHLVRLSITTGAGLAQLSAEDFRGGREQLLATGRKSRTLHPAWAQLHRLGLMAGQPADLSQVLARARLSPEQLVDRYPIRDRAVRALLIDYLGEREPSCDYTTLDSLARNLVKHFWHDLERHEPGLTGLQLTATQAHAWKRRLQYRPDGQPRRDWPKVAQDVRAFYLDLAGWAQDEPERWAVWVATCPVGPRELRALAPRRRRRQIAEMQARTRTLSPLLPQLVTAVATRLRTVEELLTAASGARPGEAFEVAGQRWHATPAARANHYQRHDVMAIDAAGRRVDLTKLEDRTFWTWAAVEILRHTGIRIEELLELTHLSIRPLRKPDGRVQPLLQIAPSKTDTERVLPVGAELSTVLSRIVTRLLTPTGPEDQLTVPVLARWDEHERVHSPALPFLFQRRLANGRRVTVSSSTIRNWLAAAAREAGLHDVDGTPLAFSPHDFRRVFLTDAVRAGLPIHIAAQLAGHDDLNTTRRYAATYPTEVIEHYQQFLARRRAERPVEEYRQPTAAELAAFAEHFGRRRVELGDCVRPYATSCSHEHACIRCPYLSIDTNQTGRLHTIENDLHQRITNAEQQAWLGDVDQLRLTLTHLQDKKNQLNAATSSQAETTLLNGQPALSVQSR